MFRSSFAARFFILSMLIGGLNASGALAADPPPALVSMGSHLLEWAPVVDFESITLSLADPQGLVRTHRFGPGEAPVLSVFDAQGMPLPDGTYTWELRVTLRRSAGRPSSPLVQSGYFTISNGTLVAPDLSEPPEKIMSSEDQMVPDDLIVDGKGCIGLGCVNNETFFAEALRLKQSVVRLRFEDTSTTAGLPARDWQLTVNDSAPGGSDRFSIDDLTAGTTPFTVRGGAPNNSLYVDGVGNVGLGTATPAQDLHVASGSTPTLRLEQTGGTVRTWDVGANNTSFFVRDVTNASAVPFRIGAGAATGSLEVASTGFVGVGTTSPATRLHFRSTDSTTTSFAASKFLVENANPTAAPRELFEVRNNGDAAYIFKNTTEPERWYFGTFAHNFIIDNQAVAGVEFFFGPTGNLTISGTVAMNSDRTTKTSIQPVDPRAMLSKIAAMPISTWRKIGDTSTHLGPMAQDFRATFGLGEDDRHIAPIDLAGVSLAGVQGLHALVEEQRRLIEKQQELIGELQERLLRLEVQAPKED